MRNTLLSFALVSVLSQAIPVENCGRSVVVTGERTAACPEGRWIVTFDKDKNEVSRRCEKPVDPTSPTPPPPSDPPPPTTTTTTTSTTSTSTTTTSTTTTLPQTPPPPQRIPRDPVPLRHEAPCRDIGFERIWSPEGVPLCVAPSVCEGPGGVCVEGQYGLTAAIMADTRCKVLSKELSSSIHFYFITAEGFGCDKDTGRGCFDAYGRVYARGDMIPNPGLEQRQPPPAGSWTYRGWCPPAAAMKPGPSPTPNPSPTPTPAPSPTPPPTGCSSCPAPSSIKVGISATARALLRGFRNTGGITSFLFGDCLHKGITRCDVECATSEGCADHEGSPHRVMFPSGPQAYQTGNGFVKHPVERQTDSCNRNDPSKLPCGYNITFATNHAPDWTNGGSADCQERGLNCGSFKYAGPMEVGVSLPHLTHWYIRRGHMGADGKMSGFDGAIEMREKSLDEKRGLKIPPLIAEPHPLLRGLPSRSMYSGYSNLPKN